MSVRARVEPRHVIDDAVGEAWDALADRVGARPFLRPGWVAAWWGAFGEGELRLLVATREGRLAGVLPLMASGREVWSTTNPHSPFFAPIGEDEEVLLDLWRAALADHPSVLGVGFAERGDPGTAAFDAAAREAGRLVARGVLARSLYVPLDQGWEEYERGLDAHRLRELRRRRRRLEERGRLSLEVDEGRADLERRLAEVLAVEGSGWKDARGTSIRSSTATRRFYEAVARWASERGWLRIAVLRLDGRPLAADLCLEDETAHYLLKTGYDPAFRELGTGLLLRHGMLGRAFELGLRSYELLGTDDPWKREWAERARELLVVRAFPRTPRGLMRWAWHAGLRPLGGRVRRSVLRVARR